MGIVIGNVGAVARATGNITPTPPAYSAGAKLLYFTGEFYGNDDIATPVGWELLSRDLNTTQLKCFGLDAVGSDPIPTVNWGAVNPGWAVIVALTGVAAAGSDLDGVGGDRRSNSTANIIGPSGTITPTANNELVIFFGSRTKTSASNGTTFTPPSGFTILLQDVPNGTTIVPVISYWLQSTATAIPASPTFVGTGTDATTQTNGGSLFILKPAAVAPSGTNNSWGLMGVGS